MPDSAVADKAPTTIDAAATALRAGAPVVMAGTERVELVAAAAHVDLPAICLMIRHGSGVLAVALPDEECDRLWLPGARGADRHSRVPNQRVSFDATTGITTGISATDRWRSIRLTADPSTTPEDLTRPGHLIPLGVADGCTGPGSAALALCRLAGVQAAACLTDVVSPSGAALLAPGNAVAFAAEHGLAHFSASSLGARP